MERIGKYEIRRVLGEGATSTVYLGYDPFAQCEVAIKRLHPELLRITDHTSLYHHLLARFAADQSGVPTRLAKAIAAADWSQAERLAMPCTPKAAVKTFFSATGTHNRAGNRASTQNPHLLTCR